MRIALVLAVSLAAALAVGGQDLIKGMNVVAWWHGRYATPNAVRALGEIASLGANWVAVVVTCYQEAVDSPVIRCLEGTRTPTEDEVRTLIRGAHARGLKVLLKPHLDIDDGTWQGLIDFGADGAAWFAAYRDFILRYARIAVEEGAEMFCVGAELGGTMSRAREWRELIRAVKNVYPGPLVYAANWGGEMWEVPFWDELDYIGIDAYYPLTGRFDPAWEELAAAWARPLNGLGCLAWREGKPIIFTEIGYRSVDGAARAPWDWRASGRPDPGEQAACYRAFFEAVWGKRPWFAGAFFWYWSVVPGSGGPTDTGYTPQGKPALEVLRSFFAGDRG